MGNKDVSKLRSEDAIKFYVNQLNSTLRSGGSDSCATGDFGFQWCDEGMANVQGVWNFVTLNVDVGAHQTMPFPNQTVKLFICLYL